MAGAEQAKVVYVFDFGDDWRYDIVVEKILPPTPVPLTRAASPDVARPQKKTAAASGPPSQQRPRVLRAAQQVAANWLAKFG